MSQEIERKFLVRDLPSLEGIQSLRYERHFLYRGERCEIRIQKKGEQYELERKASHTSISADKQKMNITKEEFAVLKTYCHESIIRDSYLVAKEPSVSIKIYHGRFEGLIRVEVEFDNESQAMDFEPYHWFGQEITESVLGRDSSLFDLSDADFQKMLLATSGLSMGFM